MEFVKYLVAGLGVGVVFGIFGAGGSAFATPILAMLGVPGLAAVASPLPAMVPAAFASARNYMRNGNLDRSVARRAIFGGVPGTLIGAFTSRLVGGDRLLILSGVLLLLVGARLLASDRVGASDRGGDRRESAATVVGATFAVGFLTGLLANGGGFLLVPLFVLLLGMSSVEAAGTSMVVVGVLTVPTLATHWGLGHIDWSVALPFAGGLIPASMLGSRLAQKIPADRSRRAFGIMLVCFSAWFLIRQLV